MTAAGAGGGGLAEVTALRQALSLQTDLLAHKSKEADEHKNEVASLDESLRALADKCSEKSNLCLAQEEEMVRLQADLQEKEKQTDMLLELMQSSDNCSNEQVRDLCRRIEEDLKSTCLQREELQREQSTRMAKHDKMRTEISQLEGKLKKASRAHQDLLRVNEMLERTTSALTEREVECRSLRLQVQQQPPQTQNLEQAHAGGASAQALARAGGVGEEAAGAGTEVKEARARIATLVAENAKLKEGKTAEEKRNEKLAASLEDVQSKNHKLMSALMVQSGQVHGDKSTEQQADVIQSLADAKFEDYLNLTTDVAENVRDDVVMDMILEYEEQLNLLQRRFIQQLKDFQ
eukprot:Tamp_01022.p2 GENE.Tamp_01022~~Tamp_01022.p2  ORF type:complete len:397 (+),score=138.64 Tamp_01022:145-1191(+)